MQYRGTAEDLMGSVDDTAKQGQDCFRFARLAQVGHTPKPLSLFTAAGVIERRDDDHRDRGSFVRQPPLPVEAEQGRGGPSRRLTWRCRAPA